MKKIVQSTIRLAIATVALSLMLRTWLVMGLIKPVTIAGSSMVPALQGPFAVATCPNCQAEFEVGVEFARRTEYAACPQCQHTQVPLASSPLHQGDRLWIDRTRFALRTPRRWEIVVLRQPDDGRQLCIKRVVGLPGETVWLSDGQVWINGKVTAKPIEKQLAMRQLVSQASRSSRRWKSETENAWNLSDGSWQHASTDSEVFDWLAYNPVGQRPIMDDVPYNAGVSRRLHRVRDLMLATTLRAVGEGQVAMHLDDGFQSFRLTLNFSTGEVALNQGGQQLLTETLSAASCRRLKQGPISLVLSNFDRQILFVLDDRVELRYEFDNGQLPPRGTEQPAALGVQGLEVSLLGLALYHDIYYTPRASWRSETPIRLGKGQYFVLGDNSPVSIDSRFWGPVPGRLLVGGPIGVR